MYYPIYFIHSTSTNFDGEASLYLFFALARDISSLKLSIYCRYATTAAMHAFDHQKMILSQSNERTNSKLESYGLILLVYLPSVIKSELPTRGLSSAGSTVDTTLFVLQSALLHSLASQSVCNRMSNRCEFFMGHPINGLDG